MKTKHTSGPWTAYQLDNSRRQILDHGGRGPRTVGYIDDADDARLIAAAPEMLAALEAVASDEGCPHELGQIVVEAIRKAKGL